MIKKPLPWRILRSTVGLLPLSEPDQIFWDGRLQRRGTAVGRCRLMVVGCATHPTGHRSHPGALHRFGRASFGSAIGLSLARPRPSCRRSRWSSPRQRGVHVERSIRSVARSSYDANKLEIWSSTRITRRHFLSRFSVCVASSRDGSAHSLSEHRGKRAAARAGLRGHCP